MAEQRAVNASAIRVFVREEGIAIEFGRDATPEGSAEDVVETVSKVLVSPGAFRRLGMSLHEALRRLPREPAAQAAGRNVPQHPTSVPGVSFIGAGGAPAAGGAPRAGATAIPPGRPAPDRGKKAAARPQISFIGSEAPAAGGGPHGRTPAGNSIGGAQTGVERRAGSPGPAKPPLQTLLEPTRHMPSSRAPAPVAGEHASRLLRSISALGAPYVYERSFRMRQGELLPNRFLLSVGRPADGSASDEALTRVFGEIGLPRRFIVATQSDLPRARCVHFGFEGDDDRPLLKVYLEIGGEEHAGADGEAVLEHVAYKWRPVVHEPSPADRTFPAGAQPAGAAGSASPQPAAGPGVVGRYWWYPHLTAEQIRERVAGVYQDGAPESQAIAFDVIGLAAERMPERDIHYLEIEEDGSPRRSYSINFYDADLKVRDLHPLLSRMRRLFDVAPGLFQVLYDQIKTRRFGHLAGGVHRNGRDFFNLYYGPQLFDSSAPGDWREALLRRSGAGHASPQ